jgi:hypothetical protein
MIETTKQKVYLLYDCDEWETYASMQVNQPIAVAFSENELIPMLIRDLKEDTKNFSEKNKTLYKSLTKKGSDTENKEVSEEIFNAYNRSKIDYRSLIILEQGYKTN